MLRPPLLLPYIRQHHVPRHNPKHAVVHRPIGQCRQGACTPGCLRRSTHETHPRHYQVRILHNRRQSGRSGTSNFNRSSETMDSCWFPTTSPSAGLAAPPMHQLPLNSPPRIVPLPTIANIRHSSAHTTHSSKYVLAILLPQRRNQFASQPRAVCIGK